VVEGDEQKLGRRKEGEERKEKQSDASLVNIKGVREQQREE